jgi:hypothetical protein
MHYGTSVSSWEYTGKSTSSFKEALLDAMKQAGPLDGKIRPAVIRYVASMDENSDLQFRALVRIPASNCRGSGSESF